MNQVNIEGPGLFVRFILLILLVVAMILAKKFYYKIKNNKSK